MFTSIIQRLGRFVHDESGPTAVEYAVMLAMIIIVCIASLRLLGAAINSVFESSGDALN